MKTHILAMHRRTLCVGATLLVVLVCSPVLAAGMDGQSDNLREDLGYYYIMTGGKFPTGTVPNGDNGSGGTFRFILDSPEWNEWYGPSSTYDLGYWHKDDWFPENASFALTLENGATIVYDNNGIEDNTYGDYYDATGLPASGDKPGLYRGYSMSNNFDWIYAGYFKLEEETTFDTIIGYYDENSGFDSDSTEIRYDMNIWSAYQDNPVGNPNSWMPTVADFTGDVFSAKATPGTFSWSYTGVDRVFGDDYGNVHDEIWRLVYTLDSPMSLPAGVYFFSHDAEVVPEPASVLLLVSAVVGGLLMLRTRRGLA